MKTITPQPEDSSEEIAALIETLHNSGQRLEQLTGGEVDTVAKRDGQTFLLRHAQDQLRVAEATKQAAILNALPANIALLDAQGLIVSVNEAWRRFGDANAAHDPGHEVGINYLTVCDRARGADSAEARQAGAGIRSVLAGETQRFTLEYPCHSATQQRWFRMTVTPLSEGQPNGVVVMHIDVTTEWQSKESLKASETRFRQMAENITDVFWVTSPDSKITHYVSPGYQSIWGRSPESLYANPHQWLETILPEERDRVAAIFANLMGSEPKVSVEYPIARPDGSVRWVHDRGFQVRDATGNLVRLTGIVTDITERKLAQEALQRQQTELRVLFDLMPAMIWFKDTDNNILRVNQRAAEASGKTVDEIEGKPSQEIYPQDAAKFYVDDLEVIRSGLPRLGIVETLPGPDGEPLWVQTDKVPYRNQDGKVIGIVVMAQDITERKRAVEALRMAEQQQQQLAENLEIERSRLVAAQRIAHIGNWETNLATMSVHWSDETHRIHETDPATFHPTHQSFLDLVHPEDRARVDEALAKSLAGGAAAVIEHRLLMPDKRIKFVEEHWQVIFDTQGVPIRAVGTCQDITARKLAERLVERALQRLTEAQRIGQIGDWEWDIATQTITWSPQVFEIVGRDPHLGPPRDYEENATIYDAPSQALMKEKVNLAIETGEAQSYELLARHSSGEQVYVLGRAIPRKDASGAVVGLYGTIQDISAHKRSEAVLKESELKYHSLFENMLEGYAYCETIFEQDSLRDFVYLEVNSAFGKLTGLEDVVGKKVSDLIPGIQETNPEVFEVYGRAALTGKPQKYEMYLQALDIWFSITVYSSDRKHIVAVFDNITARKLAEQALRTSMEEFHTLAESMPQIVWITRADGWNIYFNQHWSDYTGLTLEESLGHGWNKPFHPDDQQLAWDAWQKATAGNGVYSIESRLRRADGVYRWWLVRGVPLLGADGNILKWFGTCTDIHDLKMAGLEISRANGELRESERRFTDLLANVELISVMRDREERITYCNDYLLRLTGWKREEVIGKNWLELFVPPEIAEHKKRVFADLLLDKPAARHHESEILTRSGERRLIHWNNSVLRSGAGDVTGTASIGEDITARKQAETKLAEQVEELRRWQDVTSGREERILDLKHEVNELLGKTGKHPRYASAESQDPMKEKS